MDRFIKISDVPSHLDISKSTLYRWINQEKFISPIPLGDNRSVITQSELSEYMSRIMAGENRKQITSDIEKKRTSKVPATAH